MEQVDALWNCLAVDPFSSDDCLNWFLTTAKSKDYHALSINTLRHIFIDKVPWLLCQLCGIVVDTLSTCITVHHFRSETNINTMTARDVYSRPSYSMLRTRGTS